MLCSCCYLTGKIKTCDAKITFVLFIDIFYFPEDGLKVAFDMRTHIA